MTRRRTKIVPSAAPIPSFLRRSAHDVEVCLLLVAESLIEVLQRRLHDVERIIESTEPVRHGLRHLRRAGMTEFRVSLCRSGLQRIEGGPLLVFGLTVCSMR